MSQLGILKTKLPMERIPSAGWRLVVFFTSMVVGNATSLGVRMQPFISFFCKPSFYSVFLKARFVSVFLIVLLPGCSQEKVSDGVTIPPATRQLVHTVTSVGDREITYTLLYDSKGRLINYYSKEENYYLEVTYDDAGNAVRFELSSKNTLQIHDITYDIRGVPLRGLYRMFDPRKPGEISEVGITYVVTDDQVSEILMTDSTGFCYSRELTYSGNNLTRVVNGNPGLKLSWLYGMGRSPYQNARFRYLVIPDLFPLFASEHEIIETEVASLETGIMRLKYSYLYGADGYPVSVVVRDKEGAEVEVVRFYYDS